MPFNPSDRVDWIDMSKGIAIILVVIGHCWIGLHSAGLIHSEALYQIIRNGIYLFHMPIFFIVSGLLTVKLTTSPARRFYSSRVLLLLYPMVLWTWLMTAGKLAMGGLTNDPLTWDSATWNPLPPQWQFWFLWALFLLHIATRAVASLANLAGLRLTAGHWGALMLTTLLIISVDIGFGVVDPFIRPALLYAPFFYLGAVLSRWPDWPYIPPYWAVAGFTAAQIAAHVLAPPIPIRFAFGALAALSVMALCRWASAQWSTARLTRWLIALGLASMAIYLAHTFFSAPIRVILQQLGASGLLPHLILGTLGGILGPLGLLWIARRLRLQRVLGF